MKNFTRIPNELLSHSNLTIQERYFICVLSKYAWGNDGLCYPSRKLIARDMGLSVKMVGEYIKRVLELGLIKKYRPKRNSSNHYIVPKKFVVIENSGSPQMVPLFPLYRGNQLPTNNTHPRRHIKKEKSNITSLAQVIEVRKEELSRNKHKDDYK